MKVSSPIGDLPFEPQRLSVTGHGLELTGVMGAWPARVQIGAADVPALLRVLAKPLGIAAVATTVLALGLRHRSRR